MLDHTFSIALDSIYHSVNIVTDTIFVIDEIDKYIDYRMAIEYENEKKNSYVSKGPEQELPPLKTFEEFKCLAKTTFLYDMLSILERDGLGYSVIVIFCSNNFHSVFEGVDLTHHQSLYKRFMKVKFDECDHAEIINYLLHYNESFKGTEYY
jgi:hypothetical protein